MIWNDKKTLRSGDSNESGEHANYWEEAIDFMGAEMKPFVALMEDLIPTEDITVAGTHTMLGTMPANSGWWRWFKRD